MSFMKYFRSSKPSSASTAKERLQIIVAHERKALNTLDFFTSDATRNIGGCEKVY